MYEHLAHYATHSKLILTIESFTMYNLDTYVDVGRPLKIPWKKQCLVMAVHLKLPG
jgi:hypothetical protein